VRPKRPIWAGHTPKSDFAHLMFSAALIVALRRRFHARGGVHEGYRWRFRTLPHRGSRSYRLRGILFESGKLVDLRRRARPGFHLWPIDDVHLGSDDVSWLDAQARRTCLAPKRTLTPVLDEGPPSRMRVDTPLGHTIEGWDLLLLTQHEMVCSFCRLAGAHIDTVK